MTNGKIKRLQITQPAELVEAIRKQMDRDGERNLSKWLGECATANLDKDLRPATERPVWGRRRKDDSD